MPLEEMPHQTAIANVLQSYEYDVTSVIGRETVPAIALSERYPSKGTERLIEALRGSRPRSHLRRAHILQYIPYIVCPEYLSL